MEAELLTRLVNGLEIGWNFLSRRARPVLRTKPLMNADERVRHGGTAMRGVSRHGENHNGGASCHDGAADDARGDAEMAVG